MELRKLLFNAICIESFVNKRCDTVACYLHLPLVLEAASNNKYVLSNIAGQVVSNGAEKNLKLECKDWALYLGFTYTNAKGHNNGIAIQNLLTPKHRFNLALMYEVEGKWRFNA